jgi:predicted aconitate hydratase
LRKTVSEKILSKYIDDNFSKGEEVELQITHTLIQDSLGTMAMLQFEEMGVPWVKTEQSICFIDHNMLQSDNKNMDDHKYLQSAAAKYGLYLSRAGNGICHQVFLERFAVPGKTLLGGDSHTPSAGGAGMFAIGSGGLDVAAVMAGEKYTFKAPEIMGVELTGSLKPGVSAKDVILEILRRIGVKGAVDKVLEYHGHGVKSLSVPERSTITNMGTETGATSSIFPSDEVTRKFLAMQGREKDWVMLQRDPDSVYDESIHIDLSSIVPMIAQPHSPGNVTELSKIEGMKVDQVCIGSCTNSSLKDLKTVAGILKGKKIPENLSLTISPGSRQVLLHLLEQGDLSTLVAAGARILECACGPCIGMGQAPSTGAVSLRTFNRNFKGRSGTLDDNVYLVSPETAAASALTGVITDPRKLNDIPTVEMPDRVIIDDSLIVSPKKIPVEVVRGPNIKPLPSFNPIKTRLSGSILIKLGDNVSTDDIIAGGSRILPLRSNIPEISKYVFESQDPEFWKRAKERDGGIILAGHNYGQGSSREHAALAPKYLGVRAVIAKSYARIHHSNLVNFGIVPLIISADDYTNVSQDDILMISLGDFSNIEATNSTKNMTIALSHNLSEADVSILKVGGKLPFIKSSLE